MNCQDDKFIHSPSFSFNEVKQLLVRAQIIIVTLEEKCTICNWPKNDYSHHNSYTTQQLKNCINPEVQQGAVVFQLYYRLGDVIVDRGDQQTSYIIPTMKTTLRWQLVAGVDTFQLYISCCGKYGKPINN
jgi:hypothetical protein